MAAKPLDEEALFHAARKIDNPDARALFIDQACAGDVKVAERVRALLEMHERDSEDSKEGPKQTMEYTEVAERAGSRIGPYRLMEKIGEGGFGLVFVAEQTEPVRRKVALKIIKPGMDSALVIARFEAERQALALMDHPHIARVLDAGATDSGRPFFVMELVRGIPITEYCDQNHLTPRERMELFVNVCQAIQHAHQKGIIHRDIKPSNVMVTSHDGKPVVKVIDFGVAKAIHQHLTDRTVYTSFAQMIGTPLYMSPEQAEMSGLDIDTRSDVYSLGVLLYELLTGTTPLEKKRFAKVAHDEIRRLIREEEPPKPSQRLSKSDTLPSLAASRKTEPARLSKLVKGDLDWITMKALEKDRTRRYETANGLARDIQRYLNDEPVEACPPSATYRLRKMMKKHRAAISVAASIAFLLVAGVAVSAWQAMRAMHAEQLARTAADEAVAAQLAEKERAEGERKAKQEAQKHESEAKAVLEFLENKVFAANRPENQAGGLGYDIKLSEAIKAALPFVQTSFSDQPLIEARLRITLARSFSFLGDDKSRLEQWERARTLTAKHLGPDHPDTLVCMNGASLGYMELGRFAEALKLCEETLALRKVKLGLDHRDTLISMSNLALIFRELGRYVEAQKLDQETLVLRKATLGPDHPETLGSMNNLCAYYHLQGRYAEGLKLAQETLALRTAKQGPAHPDTLAILTNLAMFYAAMGRTAEALKLRQETLALSKAKLGPEHPDTARNMCALANSYFEFDRDAEAMQLAKEAMAIARAKLGPDHPMTLMTMRVLARAYHGLGRKAEALKLREEALALAKARFGPDHRETLLSMDGLASSYFDLGRHSESLKLSEETLNLRKAKLGPDHPDTLGSMSALAAMYTSLGRHAKALKLHEEVLEGRRKVFGPEHDFTITAMDEVASALDALGRKPEAAKLREEALGLAKAKLGPDHRTTLSVMYNVVHGHLISKRYPEAVKLGEELLPLQKITLGADHILTLGNMVNVAFSLHQLKRPADAVKLLEEALPIFKDKFPDHQFTLNCMTALSNVYISLDRDAESVKLLKELVAIRKSKLGVDHANTLGSMIQLSTAYHRLKQLPEAIKVMEEAVDALKTKFPKHPDTPKYMSDLSDYYAEVGRHAEAIKLHEEVLAVREAQLGAEHAITLAVKNELAWLLATAADAKLRDPARAVTLAAKVVELRPKDANYLGTLGTARYRAGDWKGAIADLEKVISLRKPDDPLNANEGFFLAMAHYKLGDTARAREWFERSAAWMDKGDKNGAELKRFRAEAEEVLGKR